MIGYSDNTVLSATKTESLDLSKKLSQFLAVVLYNRFLT
jgi:hypothetical protein